MQAFSFISYYIWLCTKCWCLYMSMSKIHTPPSIDIVYVYFIIAVVFVVICILHVVYCRAVALVACWLYRRWIKFILPYIFIVSYFRKSYGILGKLNGNTRLWHFNLLDMAWHQPQTRVFTLMQLSCVVLWVKMHFAISQIKDKQ